MNIVLLKKLRENFQIHYRYSDSNEIIIRSNNKKVFKTLRSEIGYRYGWFNFITDHLNYFTRPWNALCFSFFLLKHKNKEEKRRNFRMYNNSYKASMIRKKLAEDLKRIEKDKIN